VSEIVATKYYDCWSSHDDLRNDYPKAPEDSDIVYAGYTYEDYNGDALVVFLKDGQLFENNDGHCSCYGLEHWEPEATCVEALLMRDWWPGLREALAALPGDGK
jgi:hypothetical protein